MAAVLTTSAERTNKGRFCRAKTFIRNNNAADRLKASWFAFEKQENERNVRDSNVCSGFSLRGCRVVELYREFKIQRRGRQLEHQKNNRFNYQNNNFARATHFFVHFFPVFARLRRENA